MNYYDIKPYRDRRDYPATSIYVISDNNVEMEKLSCIWCKRTIADVKGHIDLIISTPLPVNDFGVAINIRCKQCHQNYRLIVSATWQPVMQV